MEPNTDEHLTKNNGRFLGLAAVFSVIALALVIQMAKSSNILFLSSQPAIYQQTEVTPTPTPEVKLFYEAEQGEVIGPFMINTANGVTYVHQQISTGDDIQNAGKAIYQITVGETGDYIVRARVKAPDESRNSLFVYIDTEPTTLPVWDLTVSNEFSDQNVWIRGGSNPKIFTLSSGEHNLIIKGREANVLMDKVWLESIDSTSLNACSASGGTWRQFTDGCGDICGAGPVCTQVPLANCDCGSTKCWNSTSKTCVANPTTTPTSGVTPTPTPATGTPTPTPTPNGLSVSLKIRLAGITSWPANSTTQIIKVYATSSDGTLSIGSQASPISVRVTPDDQGVYSGQISLPSSSYSGKYYRLRLKGPLHKQIVFDNKLVQGGAILDLTAKPLPAGDVNSDGVVNSTDLGLIKPFTTNASEIAQGDLNFDKQVDIFDKQLILITLSESFDEE